MEVNSKTAGLSLALVCLIAAFHGGSCCDSSWIRYGDNCYKIFSKIYTRYAARFKCYVEGSDLASISNITVLDLLAQHVALSDASKFWVGLTRKGDGELTWFDGTGDIKDQPWVKVSESMSGLDSRLGRCFAYNGAIVKSNSCFERLGVICSHMIKSEKSIRRCHWSKASFTGDITGNCLFRTEEKATREKADDLCINYEAYFVDVDDLFKDGLTALHNHRVLPDDGSKYWTGLTWNGTDLFWRNGAQISEEYHIPVVEGSGSCVTVMFNFSDSLQVQFHQTECGDEAHVVCFVPSTKSSSSSAATVTTSATSLLNSGHLDEDELPQMDSPPRTCPQGYNWKSDRDNNYCYWETSFETGQLSWDDAENYCKAFGGHLTSFHSVEEEKIGLSFQYGNLAHPYWIGLRLDPETETYKWTDGTSLDYNNWAPGHPDHKDKQLQCVAMRADAKHWMSSLCGILSWFVCKVPARVTQPVPVLPTPTPLESCDNTSRSDSPAKRLGRLLSNSSLDVAQPKSVAYFQGACYYAINEAVSWHRAKESCENRGATLVSIHSADEIGFLLRLLHNALMESNRVWIGLNSLGTTGVFSWTDYSPVEFTFFSENEPDNYRKQEKCCNMDQRSGEWNDENCNAAMGFVCKRRDDASVSTIIPSTVDPRIGNCKKGWISHNDRCYYLGGKRKKDQLNWTEAADMCQEQGSYLTSIRDQTDQNFLSYLLQTLGGDAWIGLHDTIQSGRYYWLDNSEVRYTNWAPGEPSFFGIMEDCVKMVYDHLESGVWKDRECGYRLGYICQTNKDPQIPSKSSELRLNCPHPEGWLKLENMCFKMFEGEGQTWQHAENSCIKEGGHLLSISDQRVKAVAAYLASEVNQAFFIGLKYDKASQAVKWLNGQPVKISNWEKNELSLVDEDTCFASTSEGYWKKVSCEEKMPYACQITTGKPAKRSQYTGACPTTSNLWVSGSKSYCYMFDENDRQDWFTANLMCFRHGSYLLSIHSLSEIEDLKKLINSRVRSIYIGLMRNKKGGFTWIDDSPVNFENWDLSEPSNSVDQCVEMSVDTMKWRLSQCIGKKHYICQDKKDTLVYEDPSTAGFVAEQSGLSTTAICIVVASILLVVFLVAAAVFYRRRSSSRSNRIKTQFRGQSVSFENALYNVGRASMEFRDDVDDQNSS